MQEVQRLLQRAKEEREQVVEAEAAAAAAQTSDVTNESTENINIVISENLTVPSLPQLAQDNQNQNQNQDDQDDQNPWGLEF
jgi:hypothetical protein